MFRFISPKFINKLDAWLLTNHPIFWMSKIHYVLWHGSVLWGISALLGWLIPVDLKRDVPYELWYFIMTVLGVLLLCPWIYHYVIFNKEKRFGTKKPFDEYLNFLLVAFAVTFFLLAPWPFELVYKNKIAKMYTDKEMIEDLNTLNLSDPYMLNSYNHFYSWRDTTEDVVYHTLKRIRYDSDDYFTPWLIRGDSLKFPELITIYQLNKRYRPLTERFQVKAKVDDYIRVSLKYNCEVEGSAKAITDRYLRLVQMDKVPENESYYYDSDKYKLERIFSNLAEAKFKVFFLFTYDYFWIMFYCVLVITMLLLLFKMNYWQQFLIALVVIGVYCIIIFIFSQLVRNSFLHIRDENFFMLGLLLLFIFSAITVVVTCIKKHHYRPFFNIFNQVFYIMLTFAPLLIVAILYFGTNLFHNHDYADNYWYPNSVLLLENKREYIRLLTGETLESYYHMYWRRQHLYWLERAQYGGIALFIIALPLFKELFIKQISLPKKS
jgi:hypothetical protein